MAQHFDAIVIGAGGVGSAAAYYLAKAGQRVLLLEQFELNHQNGSSYGYSRVIRYTYDNPIYINLMRDAYPLWFDLQAQAGEQLYVKTGGLDFGFPDTDTFQKLKTSMDTAQLDYEHLNRAEIQKRYPQFVLKEGMEGLFQSESGLLRTSRCLLAHVRLAQQHGAEMMDQTPVVKVIPGTHGVEVHTAKEVFSCDRIVLTVGSWAKSLLAAQGIELPLKIMPCQLGFYQPNNTADFTPGTFPVFFAHMNGIYGEMPYGIPHMDSSLGVKITTFYGWETVSTPDDVDYTPSQTWTEHIRDWAREYIPGTAGSLLSTRRCLYTLTLDKDFIVDQHPDYPHVIIGAGFSGHGFKFTTLLGKMLADLAIDSHTPHDTSLFKISRFQSIAT
ncbi:n-methyltryptophan oxidase [Leptolyngbya sp. Heron Island J]|uniref:N-methyl-L-tryptophan oxidase n=1 Tax=Leptolyngbya sp. Heron Island J TaxID=1385935 RepID=UPI0003B93D69|nr:N-methyl-L-tryptophan oxidase [Leptolyngbya sp. Heron Island J]ESA36457.1 n-methyltryptophan oxidase [Leptolyngbya sp. Heron Island J]